MWIVFTFVALWHDIQLNLLAWGWLICLFLLPEIVATAVFSAKKVSNQYHYITFIHSGLTYVGCSGVTGHTIDIYAHWEPLEIS
jgi:D-alanyl-lipoteichoic acid acyltransferase DltB (MBOAT superfamily)